MALFVKSSINNIEKNVKEIAERNTAKKFGPKLPGGQKEKFDIMDIVCGMYGMMIGEGWKGTKQSLAKMLNMNPQKTLFGKINAMLDKQFKDSSRRFLFDTLLDESKAKKHWTKIVSKGITECLRDNMLDELHFDILDMHIGIVKKMEEIEKKLKKDKNGAKIEIDGGAKVDMPGMGKINIFDLLQKIDDIDDKKVKDKFKSLSDLINNDLKSLVDSINELKPQDKTRDLETFLESINVIVDKILNKIPGFKKTLKLMFTVPTFDDGVIGPLIHMSEQLAPLKVSKTIITQLENFDEVIKIVMKIADSMATNVKLIDKSFEGFWYLTGSYSSKRRKKTEWQGLMGYLYLFVEEFNELKGISPTKAEFKSFFDAVEAAFKSIIDLPFADLPGPQDLKSVMNVVELLNNFTEKFPDGLDETAQENLNIVMYALEEMITPFKMGNDLADAIDNIITIGTQELLNLDNIIEYVEKLDKLSKRLSIIDKIGPAAMGGIKVIEKVIDGVDNLVKKIDALKLNTKKLKEFGTAVNKLMEVVLMSAAVLIIGSLAMVLINPANLLTFATILGIFVYTLMTGFANAVKDASDVIGLNGKNIADNIAAFTGGMVDFGKFVILAGATLLIGSMLMGVISLPAILMFGGVLAAFVFGLMYAYANSVKSAGEALDMKNEKAEDIIKAFTQGMIDFGKFVMMAGATLLIGSLLMGVINFGDLMLFALGMGVFIAAVMFAFGGSIVMVGNMLDLGKDVGEVMSKVMGAAKDFGKFLLICGSLLIVGALLGGWLMKNILNILTFTAILAGFIFVVTWVFAKASKSNAEAMEGAKQFGILLLISTGILFLGGTLFTLFPDLVPGVALFAAVLAGFVFAISIAYKLFDPGDSWKKLIAFGVVVVLSGAILLLAGNMFIKHKGLEWKIALFAVTLDAFIMGMAGILKFLDWAKISNRAMIAMGVIVGTLMLATLAFKEITNIVLALGGWERFAQMAAIVGFLEVSLLGMAGIIWLVSSMLGTPLVAGLALAAAGVMVAMAGALLLTAKAFGEIIDALIKCKDIQNIDGDTLLNNLKIMRAICEALAPVAEYSDEILAVSIAMTAMGVMMDKVAEAVQHYSELTIPIYKGTEVVGYRHLKNSDFTKASRNITLIITTIGGAVIKTYDKNPELFETSGGFLGFGAKSKFTKVAKSLESLAPLIEKIAKAVKNYASLKIPEYEGTKVVGYRTLDNKDFEAAGRNVTLIIETLGGAIVKAYDAHPDYYEGGGPGWFSKGSKFSQTVTSNMTLASLLTSIARAVKDYASLTVAEDYRFDPESKKMVAHGMRHLEDSDFEDASRNVTFIISTLGSAIVSAYDMHPDYYEGGSGGWFSSGSKFAQTVKSNMTLASLLTSIAGAVKDYASFTIAEDYQFDPESKKMIAHGMRNLTDDDFQAAARNVTYIISTLGEAIIDAYEAHPDYYEGGDGGWFSSGSKFAQTVKSNMKLADLLTSIAGAVKDYASMTIAEEYEWDQDRGKMIAHGMRHLKDNDFIKAGENVKRIIEVLGDAIIKAYKDHPEYYENEGGFLGFGGSSKFAKTIKANLLLADLISGIAKGVKDYANLTIVDKYEIDEKTGELKPANMRTLTNSDFVNAANNIKEIITVLGKSIMTTYEAHEDWFDDGEESDFAMASKAIGSMGEMISSIALGIQNYANLKMPDWSEGVDDKGNPKAGYQQLDDNVFKKAGEHIQLLIGTVGESLVNFYEKHPDYFDDGEESAFVVVTNATAKMGEMLSNMSSAISSYADLKIPIKWNEEGTAIDFRSMTDAEIQAAGNNISTIISTVGAALIGLYNGKRVIFRNGGEKGMSVEFEAFGGDMSEVVKQMFHTDKDSPDSAFSKVVSACSEMGDMIASIAEGVQTYASLNIPSKWDSNGKPTDYEKLDPQAFTDAATNIGKIITTIGGALVTTYNQNPDMFKTSKVVEKAGAGGFLGLFSATNEVTTGSDETPFEIMVRSVGGLGAVIASIAEGVRQFAVNQVPVYDDSGKISGYKEMPDGTYEAAAVSIGKIISTIGGAMVDVYTKNPDLFQPIKVSETTAGVGGFIGLIGGPQVKNTNFSNETVFDKMVISVGKLGGAIASIGQGIQIFASGEIPTLDKNGKPTGVTKALDKTDYTKAGKRIASIITLFVDEFDKIYQEKKHLFEDVLVTNESGSTGLLSWVGGYEQTETKKIGDAPIQKVIGATSVIGKVISQIASSIIKLKSSTVPIYDESSKKVVNRILKNEDYTAAGKTIATVLTTILTAVAEQAEKPIFKDLKPMETIMQVVGKAASSIGSIANAIVMYASMKFPDGETIDENGKKTTKYKKLQKQDIKNAAQHIGEVIKCLLTGLTNAFNTNEILKMFGVTSYNQYISIYGRPNAPIPPVMYAVEAIDKVSKPLASIADTIVKLAGNKISEKEFDSNGNIKSEKITKIGPDDIIKAKNNLTKILISLITTVDVLWTKYGHLFNDLNKDNSDNPISKMSKSLSTINEMISGVYSQLNSIATDENKPAQSTMFAIISDVHKALEMFGSISILLTTKDDSEYTDLLSKYGITPKFNKSFRNMLDLDYIDEIYGTTVGKIIENVASFLQNKLFVSADNIAATYDQIAHKDILITKNNDIVTAVANSLNIFISAIEPLNKFIEETSGITFLLNLQQASMLNNRIDYVGSAITKIMGWNAKIFESIKIGDSDVNDAETDIDKFVKLINKIIEIGERSANIPFENYQRIGNGALYMSNALNNIKTTKTFKQHTQQLDKYVKAINRVQIMKVDKLNKFVQGMNQLANKLGNLDKLTDAIADRLSAELHELSKQLSFSAEVIGKAEEIQEKRHKKMEKDATTIKELLNKHLTIDIKNITDMSSLTTSPGGGGGGNFTTDSISNGGGTSPDSTPAENHQGFANDQDVLTVGKYFKPYTTGKTAQINQNSRKNAHLDKLSDQNIKDLMSAKTDTDLRRVWDSLSDEAQKQAADFIQSKIFTDNNKRFKGWKITDNAGKDTGYRIEPPASEKNSGNNSKKKNNLK